jgi:ribosomal protein S18 acetylase RimI-like enzyme
VNFTLRPATRKDFRFLWKLHRVTMRPVVAPVRGWWTWQEKRRFRAKFDLEGRRVVQVDGVDVGVLHTCWEEDVLYLRNVQVMPSHQGRGLGRSLVRLAQHEAADKGMGVRLQVLQNNEDAVRLYQSLGFEITGTTLQHYRMATRGPVQRRR